MKKGIWIAVIIILAALAIWGISASRSKQSASKPLLRIGFMAPLTGPFANWGESIKNGMQLAIEDTRHKFEVDYQDDNCSARNGVTIAQQFFNVEKIKLVLGPGCVEVLRPIAPLADDNDALLFSTGLLDDSIFSEHGSVINLATQISAEAEYLAEYLKTKSIKTIATVYGTNDFGAEFGKRLPGALARRTITISDSEPTNLDLTDFRTVILRIMATKPDAIFIHQGEKQIGLFAKQLREMGYSVPLYGYYGTEATSVTESGGKSLEGMEYTYPVNSADNSDLKKAFDARYSQRFGSTTFPTATSRFVYDGMMVVDKALDSCGAADTVCIKKYIGRLGKYSGISGDMFFRVDGSLVRPFGIKKIEGGKFVWVTQNIQIPDSF
jgi:branched-chain amino acid transport system substrate-binding protein